MPIIDSRTLPDGHEIEADVCIVGSGAAGLTLAREFAGHAASVVVLESGGPNRDESMQDLNTGENVGVPYVPLDEAWLRMFGGTTNHWTAFVRPVAPNVFEQRVWIPYSGWAVTARELSPFYDRALRFLNVPERAFDVERLAKEAGDRPWKFSDDRVTTEVLHIVAPENRPFAPLLRPMLEREKNVRVHLFATVLEIRPDPNVRRVVQLRVGTPEGKRFTARARTYVLAGGAIENARLLLVSNQVQAEGLGNRHDLVGRFFANHSSEGGLEVQLGRSDLSTEFYFRKPHGKGHALSYLTFSDELQKSLRLPRVRFSVRSVANLRPRSGRESIPGELDDLRHDVAHVVADMDGAADDPRGSAAGPPIMSMIALFEPFPNPESRVRLGDARDAFGLRRVVLDWRIDAADQGNARRAVIAFAGVLGRSGIGRLRVPPMRLSGMSTFHLMGTTRMSSAATQGVVDANCRVHGIDNLYIAGGSVFPCYGIANPTLTIMALASRLADHLKGVLNAT